MSSPLADLDELVLQCRDHKARSYISEAVSSYKVGAFRSAIVGTWIAVCFDIIEKLRELALSGDAEAERQVADLEKTRESGDITRALTFERELLALARDKFELISPLEYIDLERLQADRNRCAHPSLVSEEQAYSPSAELARVHLHAAVTHLLQHPPAQGKYALERLVKDIDSEYFPIDVAKAATAFASSPLKKPRESLVRNFCLILLKRLLKEGISGKPRQSSVAALRAVAQMHPASYNTLLGEKLSALLRTLDDKELEQAVRFVVSIPDCWQFVAPDLEQRLQAYVQQLPTGSIGNLEVLLAFTPLKTSAERRARSILRPEVQELEFWEMPTQVMDRVITILLESKSLKQANEIANHLRAYSMDISKAHLVRIVAGAKDNIEVLHSAELGHLLANVRARKVIPEPEFDALLAANDLSIHIPAAGRKA